MKTYSRYFRAAITFILLVSLLGCSSATNTTLSSNASKPTAYTPAANNSVVTVTILAIQDYAFDVSDLPRVTEAVNKLLSKHDVPVKLSMKTIQYDQFYPSTASGEGYDITVIYGNSALRQFAQENLLADLTDFLPQFQDLYKVSPENAWKSATVSGKVYGFPLVTRDSNDGVWETGVLIRQDILNAINAPAPTSPDELLSLALRAKELKLNCQIAYSVATPPYALHRTYSQWPFYVDSISMFLYTPDSKPEAYAESDIYRQDKELLSKLNAAGVLRIFYNQADIDTFEDQFNCFASFYPIICTARSPHAADMRLIQFNPEKANFPIEPISSSFLSISSKSEHVSDSLKLLQAIYTTPVIYDAFMYGQKDRDWIEHSDGSIEIQAKKCNAYTFDHNSKARKRYQSIFNIISSATAAPGTLTDFPATGFIFNTETDELKKFQDSVLKSFNGYEGPSGIIGLRCLNDPEAKIKEAVDTMKEAGLDQLLDAYQQQYNSYLEGLK